MWRTMRTYPLPEYLPAPKEKFPCRNPFVIGTAPLPETFFPNMKRTLIHRPYNPEIDGKAQYPNKRLRVCPSPQEHKILCDLMKLERDNEKLIRSTKACDAHASFIRMPAKVMTFLQRLENKTSKLKDFQNTVMEQITGFSNLLRESVRRFEEELDTSKSDDRIKHKNLKVCFTQAQFETFRSSYAFVLQMLKNFKGMLCEGYEDNNDHSRTIDLGSAVVKIPVSLPDPVILYTFECLKQIRALIHNQCHFDCDEEMDVSMEDSRGGSVLVTFELVLQCIIRMERNMREYMKRIVVKDIHNRSRLHLLPLTTSALQHPSATAITTSMSQSLPPVSDTSAPIPLFSSTPKRKSAWGNTSCHLQTNKRSMDTSVEEIETELKQAGHQSQVGFQHGNNDSLFGSQNYDSFMISKRIKKTPKRVTFAFLPENDSMEIDNDLGM